ncbi:MAG: hypothetical protein FJY88_13515, partial [Candidatus Eisenbacteria bacterium]|nr:hypothetical protein [Candidatus Eisenbacteria bacterium]
MRRFRPTLAVLSGAVLFASILIPPAASSPLPSAAPREVITSADRAYDAATGVLRRWRGIESRQIDG